MSTADLRGRSRTEALFKAGVAAVAARGGSTVTTLLLTPVLARHLGIEGYGVFVTLTLTASLLLLGDLGVSSGLVTKISGNRQGAESIRTAISSAYAVVIGTTLVAMLLAAAVAWLLPWSRWTNAPGMSTHDVTLAAFFALMGAALQMTTNLGQRIELAFQRGHVAAGWLAVANVAAPVCATITAVATGDVVLSVAAMALVAPGILLVQSVVVIRHLDPAVRPSRHHVTRKMVRELLGSGLQFSGIALLGAIAFQLDTLIVSSFLGAETAAKYSVTVRLFALIATTLQVAATQLWSAFADAARHGDAAWARRVLVRSVLVCGGLSTVASVVLVVAGRRLIDWWIGPEFVPSLLLLCAAGAWTIVSCSAAPIAFFLNGNDRVRQQLVIGVPMVIANVGLSVWWVQLMGASGVLWASCVAWMTFVALPLALIARQVLRSLDADAAQRPIDEEVVPQEVYMSPLPTPAKSQVAQHVKGYRPDLDGLRAGAVLAVIGFHYFPGLVPGGFVGVDVFFVVSGFLITGLVAQRIDRGTFTIRDFYARRVRRIFPALLLVISTTLVAGWILLFSDEFRALARQASAGAFFVANLFFWSEASYFDPGAYTKPLLHLWSLAIEEQFYLVWPLLMVVLLRRGRRFAIIVIVLLTAASFGHNLLLALNDPTADYYSPTSRFWQLAAGGLLALGGWTVRRAWLANTAAIVGALLIAGSVMTFSSASTYPGAYGAAPVLGTVLLIAAGQKSFINQHILSWRLAVGIGLISYPLYLWHWPLISFATIVGQGFPSFAMRGVLVLVSFALAYATYRLVETPLRFGELARKAPRRLAIGVAAVGLFGLFVVTPAGPPSAHSGDSGPIAQLGRWDHLTNATCDDRNPFKDKVGGWWFCVTNHDTEPDVLLLGDSLANALYPGAVDVDPAKTVLSIGTCAPTRGVDLRPVGADPSNPCFAVGAEKQEAFMDTVVRDHPAATTLVTVTWPRFDASGGWVNAAGASAGDIVLRGAPKGTTDREAWVQGLERRLEDLRRTGSRVVLVGPVPEIPYDISQCFSRPFNEKVQPCTEPRSDERARFDQFKSVADEAAATVPGVEVVDVSSVFCDESTCSLVKDGEPLLRDEVHLSELGSRLVVAEVARQVGDLD